MIRTIAGAVVAVLTILGASGCGVNSEEEPQPLEKPVEQPRMSTTVQSSASPTATVTSTTATSPPVTDVRTAPAFTPGDRTSAR